MDAKMDHIEKAFTLAHRASENGEFPPEARAVFRTIAHQVWLSCGGTPAWKAQVLGTEANRQKGAQA